MHRRTRAQEIVLAQTAAATVGIRTGARRMHGQRLGMRLVVPMCAITSRADDTHATAAGTRSCCCGGGVVRCLWLQLLPL
jgi:hypothetical protein